MELLITIIVLALIFDYINGFHDAANAIATIVSTKVLTPLQAVIWAAFFNFLAFFIAKYLIGDFGIANTVSKTVYEQYITLPVILSGVIAAIIWNLWTWWRGIPSSSSHTLIGGFAGAAIAAYGFGAIQSSVILKIVLFIFLGQHHPHHIRSHHRSGRHPSPVRSALGSYPKPDDSLGAYHPGKCGIGSSHLCTDRVTNLFFQGITNKEEKIAQTSDSSKKRTFIEIILLTFITFAHIVSNIVQFENGNTRQFYTTC